ncbi:hypothetical protein QTP88_017915 [Uroleucon formosanum]
MLALKPRSKSVPFTYKNYRYLKEGAEWPAGQPGQWAGPEVGEPVNEKQETFSIEQTMNDVDPDTFNNASVSNVHNQEQDHGNFLELIILLSKYDVVLNEHLNKVMRKSQKNHDNDSKGRGNLVTFLSHYTIDNIITIISNLIKSTITKKVNEANMFSVLLDTTQDVSVMDQCSIVLRFVTDGMINERLISVKSCTDSTGKGMMNLLQNALEMVGLNIRHCIGNSTDGAANMRGTYNGFTSWLSVVTPEQVHVWCYSHVLNLVISDTTKSPITVANFFSLIHSCAVFF